MNSKEMARVVLSLVAEFVAVGSASSVVAALALRLAEPQGPLWLPASLVGIAAMLDFGLLLWLSQIEKLQRLSKTMRDPWRRFWLALLGPTWTVGLDMLLSGTTIWGIAALLSYADQPAELGASPRALVTTGAVAAVASGLLAAPLLMAAAFAPVYQQRRGAAYAEALLRSRFIVWATGAAGALIMLALAAERLPVRAVAAVAAGALALYTVGPWLTGYRTSWRAGLFLAGSLAMLVVARGIPSDAPVADTAMLACTAATTLLALYAIFRLAGLATPFLGDDLRALAWGCLYQRNARP